MFQFSSTVTRFLDCFLEITTNPNFWVLQGSAATYWRHGGKYYMGFVGNVLLYPVVKECWKSVKNWQSYRREFGELLFLGHNVYGKADVYVCGVCFSACSDVSASKTGLHNDLWSYSQQASFAGNWCYMDLPSCQKCYPGFWRSKTMITE